MYPNPPLQRFTSPQYFPDYNTPTPPQYIRNSHDTYAVMRSVPPPQYPRHSFPQQGPQVYPNNQTLMRPPNNVNPSSSRLKTEEKDKEPIQRAHKLTTNYEEDEQYADYAFPDPHVSYKIMPAEEPKLCLDVTTVDKDDLVKGNIIIWDYHGGPNQNFYFHKVREGTYVIINAATGFAIEAPAAGRADQLQMNPRDNSPQQQWRVEECGKHLFKIRSFCNDVMDIKNHFLRNGNPVLQYKDQNSKNQKWKIQAG